MLFHRCYGTRILSLLHLGTLQIPFQNRKGLQNATTKKHKDTLGHGVVNASEGYLEDKFDSATTENLILRFEAFTILNGYLYVAWV